METLVELDSFSGDVTEVTDCYSVLISDREQPDGTVDTSALIATYGEENDLQGVIVNSEPAAVRWAETWYEGYRDAALPMDDAMTDED
jgi:hypothetical protein